MNTDIFRGGRPGEIAVIGLGRSGRAAAELLARDGHRVYASDAGTSDETLANASTLRLLGAAVDVGDHDLERIAAAALVVASPGVPPAAPPIAAARGAGVPVVGEIEIALHYLPELRYIAVTGTNGKTTTTALIGHLLRALGHHAVEAGNIGLPLASVALMERRPAWVALELSSFQLHDTPSIAPTVGLLTNLSPDHLDRYAGADEYYADKRRLFANAARGSKWVLNGDDAAVCEMARDVPGDKHYFAVKQVVDADAGLVQHHEADQPPTLWLDDAPLIERDELRLLGDHNVANALAAALAVLVADPGHAAPDARPRMADGLRSFRALEHRLELVGEYGGVEWINDSKATNVSSTRVALEGMTRPFVLLLGGRHKGEPYTSLADPLRNHAIRVLAYGESAPMIERDLGGLVAVERLGSSFDEVIARARAIAPPGAAVLLSPACSSFDMFANYAERGREFRRLAALGASPAAPDR